MAIENIILIFNVRATHGSGQLADLPQATTIGGVEGAGGAEVQSLGSAVVFSYNPIWGVPEMGDPQKLLVYKGKSQSKMDDDWG